MNIEIIETEEIILTKSNKKHPLFSHEKWRYTLLKTEKELKQLHPNYSVCGPFGFELLSNADSAPKHMRKFYLYVNNPEEKSIDLISQVAEEYTFKNIELYYPEILNDFVIKISNQHVNFLHPENPEFTPTDKLFDIQVRNTQGSIAEDYANYIILSYQTILQGIGEASNYESFALYRSRMFQLSLMLFKLYSPFLPKEINAELSPIAGKLKPFINNSLTVFFESFSHKISTITELEKFLVNTYVIPLCNNIDKLLSDSSKNAAFFQLNIEPYHVESIKKLEANIGTELYNSLLNTVINTYKNFC